ncbi:Na(+)/H(+) antiporter subunit B [soil metagenome]
MIRPFESLMLRTLLGPLVAAMQLFAVYVVVHGHYSPGGGFQGGILLAASIILPLLVSGRDDARLRLTLRAAITLTAIGVLIFAVIAILPMIWGEPLLSYGALPIAEDMPGRHSLGILLIEIGVTIAVAGSMVSIFYGLTDTIGGAA